MTPETEDRLLRYLAEGKTERVGLGEKMDLAAGALGRILHQLELHEQKDDYRHDQITETIKGLSSRISTLEREADDTGQHNIEELRQRLKERDATLKETKTGIASWVQWTVGLVVGLVLGAAGLLIGRGK